jgi:hypothetical protein
MLDLYNHGIFKRYAKKTLGTQEYFYAKIIVVILYAVNSWGKSNYTTGVSSVHDALHNLIVVIAGVGLLYINSVWRNVLNNKYHFNVVNWYFSINGLCYIFGIVLYLFYATENFMGYVQKVHIMSFFRLLPILSIIQLIQMRNLENTLYGLKEWIICAGIAGQIANLLSMSAFTPIFHLINAIVCFIFFARLQKDPQLDQIP